jgi:hypothetical protein
MTGMEIKDESEEEDVELRGNRARGADFAR